MLKVSKREQIFAPTQVRLILGLGLDVFRRRARKDGGPRVFNSRGPNWIAEENGTYDDGSEANRV